MQCTPTCSCSVGLLSLCNSTEPQPKSRICCSLGCFFGCFHLHSWFNGDLKALVKAGMETLKTATQFSQAFMEKGREQWTAFQSSGSGSLIELCTSSSEDQICIYQQEDYRVIISQVFLVMKPLFWINSLKSDMNCEIYGRVRITNWPWGREPTQRTCKLHTEEPLGASEPRTFLL